MSPDLRLYNQARPRQQRWRFVALRPGVPVVSEMTDPSFVVEQYRKLAVQLVELMPQAPGPGYVLAVTSPDSRSGKTLTSLNLALTLGRRGEKHVLLVEADLWRPTLKRFMTVEPSTPGFYEILTQKTQVQATARLLATRRGIEMEVLTAGDYKDVGDLMTSPRLERAIEHIKKHYQIVVVDAPSTSLAAGRSVAKQVDGVLVIVRAGRTRKRDIEELLSDLGSERVLGLAFNCDPNSGRAKRRYALYYGSAELGRQNAGTEPPPRIARQEGPRSRGPVGWISRRLSRIRHRGALQGPTS